jgi:hypothetical protein
MADSLLLKFFVRKDTESHIFVNKFNNKISTNFMCIFFNNSETKIDTKH